MVQKKPCFTLSLSWFWVCIFFLASGVQTKSEKPNGGARDVHVFV